MAMILWGLEYKIRVPSLITNTNKQPGSLVREPACHLEITSQFTLFQIRDVMLIKDELDMDSSIKISLLIKNPISDLFHVVCIFNALLNSRKMLFIDKL